MTTRTQSGKKGKGPGRAWVRGRGRGQRWNWNTGSTSGEGAPPQEPSTAAGGRACTRQTRPLGAPGGHGEPTGQGASSALPVEDAGRGHVPPGTQARPEPRWQKRQRPDEMSGWAAWPRDRKWASWRPGLGTPARTGGHSDPWVELGLNQLSREGDPGGSHTFPRLTLSPPLPTLDQHPHGHSQNASLAPHQRPG